METLQNLLTIAFEATAILGFGGIGLHAFWTSHTRWMETYCPTIKPLATEPQPAPQPAPQPQVEPQVEPQPTFNGYSQLSTRCTKFDTSFGLRYNLLP